MYPGADQGCVAPTSERGSGPPPPPTFYMSFREGLVARAETCLYQHFSMAYAPRGSAPTVAGSRNALISVADSSTRLWVTAIRDWWTALVAPLATFRLWRGFWRKVAILSINRMESGDIQKGRGGRFSLRGTNL